MVNESKLNMIRPFGPAIGSADIPKALMDKINNFIDEIVKDKNKSKQLDAGKPWRARLPEKYFYLKK